MTFLLRWGKQKRTLSHTKRTFVHSFCLILSGHLTIAWLFELRLVGLRSDKRPFNSLQTFKYWLVWLDVLDAVVSPAVTEGRRIFYSKKKVSSASKLISKCIYSSFFSIWSQKRLHLAGFSMFRLWFTKGFNLLAQSNKLHATLWTYGWFKSTYANRTIC